VKRDSRESFELRFIVISAADLLVFPSPWSKRTYLWGKAKQWFISVGFETGIQRCSQIMRQQIVCIVGLRMVRIASSASTVHGSPQSSTHRDEFSNRDFEFVRVTLSESHCNWTRNSRIPGSPDSMVASNFRRAKSGSTKYPSTSF
jgi:hypothetical protein